MRHTVVTSFSPDGWKLYGRNFVGTFDTFWPMSVKLICVWEGQPPRADLNGFDLLETEPARSFFARHQDNPAMHGRAPHQWSGRKSKAEKYNFRFDAYKFAHKVFALTAAARYVEDGKLYWFDADVVTSRVVTLDLLHDVLPDHAAVSYLPRPDYSHSECGFIGFDLDKPEARAFLTAFESVYATDEFINLKEWHDSAVFDDLIARLRISNVHHLTHNSRAQPFDDSVLGSCMTHLKGRRKLGEVGWVDR